METRIIQPGASIQKSGMKGFGQVTANGCELCPPGTLPNETVELAGHYFHRGCIRSTKAWYYGERGDQGPWYVNLLFGGERIRMSPNYTTVKEASEALGVLEDAAHRF